MSQQPIEYRQIYARLFAVRVQNGKHFTDSASEALQEGRYTDALQDLAIARSFFPDNERLEQLIQIVKSKRDKAQQAARPEPRSHTQPSAPTVAPPPSSLPPPAPPLVLAGALPPPNLGAQPSPPALPPPAPPERGPALSNNTMGNSSIFGVSPSGGAVAGAVSAARLPGGGVAHARPRRVPALTPEERPIEPDAAKRPPGRASTQDGPLASRGFKQDP